MLRKKVLRFMSLLTACIMLSSIVASAAGAAVASLISPKSKNLTGRIVDVSVSYDSQSVSVKIDTVVLYIDSKMYEKKKLTVPEQKGVMSFDWDTQSFARGQHMIEVKLFSNNKVVTSVMGSGIVSDQLYDNTAPVVKFEGIKNGDVVSGKKIINISAKDDSGEPPIVSLLVDKKLKLMQNNAPYAYTLDTTYLEDGEHFVDIYAFDNDGNQSDRVSYKILVNNGGSAMAASQPAAETKVASAKVVSAPSVKVASEAVAGRTDNTSTISASVETKAISNTKTDVKVVAGGVFTKDNKTAVNAKLEDAKVANVKNISAEVFADSKVGQELKMTVAALNAPVPSVNIETPKAVSTVAVKPVVKPIEKLAEKPVVKPVEKLAEKSVVKPAVKSVVVAKAAPMPKLAVVNNNSAASETGNIKVALNTKNGSVALSAPNMDLSVPKPVVAEVKNPVISADTVNISNIANKPIIKTEPIKVAKADITAKVPLATRINTNLILPTSGKAKIRDVVAKNGGIVLWDGKSKTVTSYVNDIKLEMRIGSKVVKVNGKTVTINVIPRIENGRTIIDVTDFKRVLETATKENK